jgi:thiamine pyrophosphate-dependent acetolactate synthase large subunit-like protein
MPERFEEAFRLYEEARGPVVLLVTQSVIDSRDPLPRPPVYPPRAADTAHVELSSPQEDALAKALAILGRERTRVLWQTSRLDAEEEELVHSIADRAGIALVDTLGHPGPSHRGGRRVPSYLGTLGLYGFNQRSYAFLHPDGKLAPRDQQVLFFLKSKVGQRATNFTPFRRAGLRMVQLTHRADHVAPDVELALVMDAKDFLRRVHARLDVDPEVRRHRVAAIQAAAAPPLDLASRLPSLPMSPNYFLRELGGLFERLVEDEGYTYTGVFDVGRCSVSATRSVPRTARGFSGWYGRALMGDAPAALPTLAVTEPGNVVAFVGDGARSLIADPVPALLENAQAYPERFDKNVTLFYFSNGTFSGIRTYRERLSSKWGGRQMRAFDLLAGDSEQDFGPLHVVRRTLSTFDPGALREALLARRRFNILTVLLGHNNEDDGFSLVTAGWQRDAPQTPGRRGSDG